MQHRVSIISFLAVAILVAAGPAVGQSISSPAIRVGDMLYLSAAGSMDFKATKRPEGMEAATRQVMRDIKGFFEGQGFTFADVVFTELWTTDLGQAEKVNKVYRKVFKGRLPSGTMTEVSALPDGSKIQIAMIATKGKKRIIQGEGTQNSSLTFSPGTLAGDTLFISGQTGPNVGDIKAQVGQALKNVGSILREAGMSFANVAQANVFLTNPADFAPMGEVYRSFTQQPRPARVPIGAIRLPLNGTVQITMLAKQQGGSAILPPDMEPTENYSRGLLVKNELYIAGIGSASKSLEEGMEDCLTRAKKIVRAAGMSMEDVIQARIYLSDIGDLEAIDRAYRRHFGTGRPPTRAVAAVTNLPASLKIMTSFVAAKGQK